MKPLNNPVTTSGYERLLELAREDDIISVDLLRRLLPRINAHPDLVAFGEISTNLLRVIRLIQEQWSTTVNLKEVVGWIPALEWVVLNRNRFGKEIASFDLPVLTKRHALDGKGLVDHCLYAALWNKYADPAGRDRFCLLQGHLLLARLSLLERGSVSVENSTYAVSSQDLPYSFYPATYTLRWISLGSSTQHDYLAHLPVTSSPVDFARQLARTSLRNQSEELFKRHRTLVSLFSFVYSAPDQSRPHSGSSGRGGGRHMAGFVDLTAPTLLEEMSLGDRDDSDNDWGRLTRVIHVKATEEERRQLLQCDEFPEEGDEEDTIGLADFDTNGEPVEPGNFLAVAWAQNSQLAMANQLLPWTWNVLALQEVKALFEGLARWLSAAASPKERRDRLELVAFISVSFYTTSTTERTRTLQLLSPETNKDAELALIVLPNGIAWRVRAMVPRYQYLNESQAVRTDATTSGDNGPAAQNQYRSNRNVASGVERKRADYVLLPDIAGVSKWVLKLYEEQAKKPTTNAEDQMPDEASTAVFRRRKEWYQKRFAELIRDPVINPTGRITQTKIAQFLFYRVLSLTQGDVTTAALVTSYAHPLIRVRQYYATPAVRTLQDLYVQAVRSISILVGPDAQNNPSETLASDSTVEEYVGSRFCPTIVTVQTAISAVIRSLRELALGAVKEDLVAYHNAFTLYSVWSFAFAIGIRGIVNPYISLACIHPKTGLAEVADKDGTGYKTRVVWVPSAVQAQMRFYDEHTKAMRRVYPQLTHWNEPCFFLTLSADERVQPEEVRPLTLAAKMEPYLPFPANVHRRFVRNELLSDGCSPQVVDAWMGHWHRGEEPWGPYSSFSYFGYRTELETHLVPLLRKLGFRSIRSVLR